MQGDSRLEHRMEAMIQATQKNEESRLNYDWAISAERQTCHVYETISNHI
jgi:hypothetical protein